ncbi:MAG: histidinol-phosphatase [Desulfobulbaceae bacterium]|nr:histidinol-phosphatase [Desulfobulbaceae bacterium]
MTPLDLKTDGHVHSCLCHHAVGEMEDYVLAACDKGLERLIFLEHFEIGIRYFETTWLTAADFEVYFTTGRALQRKYRDRVDIGLGVEVGYNPEKVAETIAFLRQYDWDRIGLSYHFLRHEDEHLNLLSRKTENMAKCSSLGVKEILRAYFEGLRQALGQLPATVLCHLDAALRHHPEIMFDNDHKQLMEAILVELAAKDIALEINTSGFDHRQQPYPPPWLIRQAQELGVKLVAGSDAHRPQDVGRYFDRLPMYLLSLESGQPHG